MNINNVSVKSIILILFFFLSVSAQEKKYILNTVAFYNVENLLIQLMTQITHGMKQELQRERINGQIKNMKLNLIILQKYYQG